MLVRTYARLLDAALRAETQATEACTARLQDSVDLAAMQADLARVVHRALEPAHISLWTNDRG